MQTAERARDAIELNNKTFAERFAAGDAAGVAGLYTEDGQIFPPNLPGMTGREAIAAFWSGAMGMGLTALELVTDEVSEAGETAVECGQFRLFVGDDVVDNGKYLVVWHLDGGSWRLHRDIWNTSREA